MERELLLKAQAGDPGAISEIVRTHQGLVRRYVSRLAPDAVTADDLAQEVFLAALQSLDRIDPRLGIRGYLLGIARNLGRLEWRKRMKGKADAGEAFFTAILDRCPADDAESRSDHRVSALQECLQGLAPRALDVVLRFYREEQACDDISRDLGSTPGTIRSILTRARQALRECVRIRIERAPA